MDIYSATEEYTIRKLRNDDFSKGYKDLLGDLTVTGDLDDIKFAEIFQYQASHSNQYTTIVIEESSSGMLVGNGVLFLRAGHSQATEKLGMIEDIVVLKRMQGSGLGKKIITTLLNIARNQGCSKVVLDCSESNEKFYNRCGLSAVGVEMSLYF